MLNNISVSSAPAINPGLRPLVAVMYSCAVVIPVLNILLRGSVAARLLDTGCQATSNQVKRWAAATLFLAAALDGIW